jgi:glyoxylase I family protein
MNAGLLSPPPERWRQTLRIVVSSRCFGGRTWEGKMPDLPLHHVSIVVRDLDRSINFYQDLLDLERVERPPFKTVGAWLACGDAQIHLILNPAGSFRSAPTIDTSDWHFALRTDTFGDLLARLRERGYREDLPEGDPKRLLVHLTGAASFPQLYFLDPDNNLIEVNGAPIEQPPLWREAGLN